MSEDAPEKRKQGTLAPVGGAISFIGALVALAKNGHMRALSKLEDIERWLHSIAQNLH